MVASIPEKTRVAVIGGGPAGATVAALLAQQGVEVHVLERDAFPRFHIGESLMPETYWVFQRIGILDSLKNSHFTKKYSVQFVSDTGKESQPFYFFENNPHECSQTWQVLRSEFDQMMIDNARARGASVWPGTRVLNILFDGDQARGVRYERDGVTRDLWADVVVDASGQSTLLANRLDRRQGDPRLRKGSVWSYFANAHRGTGYDEGATLVMHTEGKQGWFWYIPLHDDVVSVGVVSDLDQLFLGRGEHEQIFHEEVERCPAVKWRLENARRVDRFRATKDFSYHSRTVAGQGWVLVGDAFGFLDPIYSSGVFLALKSGELAADAIVAGLATNDLSPQRLGAWGPDFLKGMDRMKHLVYAFYDGFSFGQFIRRHPEFKRHIIDLLVGDLFKDSVDEVFGPMDAMRAEMATVGV